MIIPCTTPAPDSLFRMGGDPSALYLHMAYGVPVSFSYPIASGTLYTNIVDASSVGPMNVLGEQYVIYALGVATNGTHLAVAADPISSFAAHVSSGTDKALILGTIDGRGQFTPPSPLFGL